MNKNTGDSFGLVVLDFILKRRHPNVLFVFLFFCAATLFFLLVLIVIHFGVNPLLGYLFYHKLVFPPIGKQIVKDIGFSVILVVLSFLLGFLAKKFNIKVPSRLK